MVDTIFSDIIYPALYYCQLWTNQLMTKLGVGNLVLVAFTLVFIINALFMPFRGAGISNISYYSDAKICSKKIRNGRLSGSGATEMKETAPVDEVI